MCHFQNTLKNELLPLEGREIAAPPAGNLSSSETVKTADRAQPCLPTVTTPQKLLGDSNSLKSPRPAGRGLETSCHPPEACALPGARTRLLQSAAAPPPPPPTVPRNVTFGRCVDKNSLINFLTDKRRQDFSKQENLIHLHSAPGR